MNIDLQTLENINDLGNRIDAIKAVATKATSTTKKVVAKKRKKRVETKKGSADGSRFKS